MAEKSRLEFVSFRLDAEGVLENEDGILRFTEIKLRPLVAISNEVNRDRVIHLRLIARSLQYKVVLYSAVKIKEESPVPVSV